MYIFRSPLVLPAYALEIRVHNHVKLVESMGKTNLSWTGRLPTPHSN